MTPKQFELLKRLGLFVPGVRLTGKQAGELIERTMAERKQRASEFVQEARQADLYDLASKSITKWSSDTIGHAKGPCPMPSCGSSRFYVNKHENVGGCMKCNWEADGKGAGPIGYIAALDGLEWWEAAEAICNDTLVSHPVATPVVKVSHDEKIVILNREWSAELARGQATLAGSPAMNYLSDRGIAIETARTFGVGSTWRSYKAHPNTPCALFPYYQDDGTLCALNRRVACRVTHDKNWFAKHSVKELGLFGVWADRHLTWVFEGEINAMSAFQVLRMMGRNDTVLSVSGEGDVKGRAGELAGRFGDSLIVWCDDKEIADTARSRGVKYAWATRKDANDLYRAGRLSSCISWILKRVPH